MVPLLQEFGKIGLNWMIYIKKNHIILFLKFITLVLCLILFHCAPSDKKPLPKAVKGILDLREWDFEKDGNINLDGEWEFYWKEFPVGDLSHEIKTPLVSIYGYSEMITLEEDLPESTKEYGREIYKSAGHLNSYMDDVLLVTDLETNLQLDKKNHSLAGIIENSLQSLEPLLREKEIQLSIPDLSSTTVLCDSVLFGRALGNILKNAISYNKKGGTVALEVKQREQFRRL